MSVASGPGLLAPASISVASRELRHTFASLMSDSDVAAEEIARLVGHASCEVTETVDRHQLRPVLTTGAENGTPSSVPPCLGQPS